MGVTEFVFELQSLKTKFRAVLKIVLQHKCKTQLMERDTQCPVGFKFVTVMNRSIVVPLSLCCRLKCLDPL